MSCAALALVMAPAALGQTARGGGPPGQWTAGACSGHGQVEFNRCACDPGWSGSQCASEEPPPDCGDHGRALHGRCVCDSGWKGRTCRTAPLVCVHGKAAHGKCACDAGWSGGACDKGPPPG
jgi:hypothetical protein